MIPKVRNWNVTYYLAGVLQYRAIVAAPTRLLARLNWQAEPDRWFTGAQDRVTITPYRPAPARSCDAAGIPYSHPSASI